MKFTLLNFAYSNHNKHPPDQSHGENSSFELTKATKSLFEPLEHTSLIKFITCLSSLSWFVWSYHFYCSTHWREFCWFQSIAVKHTEERKKEMRLKNQYIGFLTLVSHIVVYNLLPAVWELRNTMLTTKCWASLAMPAMSLPRYQGCFQVWSAQCLLLQLLCITYYKKTRHGMLTPAH